MCVKEGEKTVDFVVVSVAGWVALEGMSLLNPMGFLDFVIFFSFDFGTIKPNCFSTSIGFLHS